MDYLYTEHATFKRCVTITEQKYFTPHTPLVHLIIFCFKNFTTKYLAFIWCLYLLYIPTFTGLSSNTNLKEGILWNVANDGPVPEGFTIYTTDSGLTVLRRKRQRNLNKLGIGGFVVRQRHSTAKAQADEDKDADGSQGFGGKHLNIPDCI